MDLGVNLSGAEFGAGGTRGVNYDYTYPTHAEIDYYASKGLDVIRLPVLWERVQPTENGPLDAAQLSYIDNVVNYAATKGIKVDLDIHNFGYGYGNQVGSSGTPDSAFADLWGKLAAHFSGTSNIMFGLMNEPHDISATQWLGAANAAIAAIRASGAHQEILVPGTYWDGGSTWTTTDNATVLGNGIVDTGHNFAFEIHQYLDQWSSGTDPNVVSTTIGVERLTAVTQWAEQTGNKLFLGEFGTGTDQTSLTALSNMLHYMSDHSDVWQGGTEWGGGPWWGNYMYSVEPTGLGTSSVIDKPQIGILESYLTQAGPSTITTNITGSVTNWRYAPGSTIDFTGSFTVAQNMMIAGDPTIFVDHGQTETFLGNIADSSVSDPGIIEKTGSGTLVLSGTNTFSGGTVLAEGSLELASLHAAGTGSVTFGAGAQTLIVDHAALTGAGELTNHIVGFAADGKVIDVRGIGQDATAHFDDSTDTFTLSSTSGSSTLATLHFSQDYKGFSFTGASDGMGGVEVALIATVTSPVAVQTVHADESFDFGFLNSTVTRAGLATLLVGPDGVAHDVTGVSHLHFADGTINEANGSPLVDDLFYDAVNKDVYKAGADPDQHYNQYGWHEGRDPDAFFSTDGYLAANPDVARAGINPLQHYDSFGWKEGRDPSAAFDTELYLKNNPDVAKAGIDPLAHYLQYGQAEGRQTYAAIGPASSFNHGSFDAEYYLLANPDVAKAALAAGGDTFAFAYQHYEQYGWHEGRNPNAYFDVNYYLSHNTDVASAHMDPLTHYDQYGWKEGRDASAAFHTVAYEQANSDVAAAHVDPLQHYLQYGADEGRHLA